MYKLQQIPNYPISLDRSKMSYIIFNDEEQEIKFSLKVAKPVVGKLTLENQLGNLVLEWAPSYQVKKVEKLGKSCQVWLKKVGYKLPNQN